MDKKLNRIGLFRDKKHRIIYSKNDTTHYVIHDTDTRKYEFYYNRVIFSITLAALISILNPYLALAVGGIAYLVLEFLFRKVFLNKCQVIDTFTPDPESPAFKPKQSQLFIISIAYIAVGGLLIALALTDESIANVQYVAVGIAAVAILTGVKNLIKAFNYNN